MDWKTIAGPLLQSAAPTLAKILLSEIPIVGPLIAGPAGDAIGALIAAQFGVPATPGAVIAAINGDPTASDKLAAAEAEAVAKWPAMAQMEVADVDSHKADLLDIQDARAHMDAYAKEGSILAYGAALISAIVVIGFFVVVLVILDRPAALATPEAAQVLGTLLGFLGAGFVAVIQYWLGSSVGSKGKDNAMSAALLGSQQTVRSTASSVATAIKKK